MKYNVDHFISKFEAEPEESWCEDRYVDDRGRMCALGKCGELRYTETEEGKALRYLFEHYLLSVAQINDGLTNTVTARFRGPTAKQRVLAALYWIKEQEAKL